MKARIATIWVQTGVHPTLNVPTRGPKAASDFAIDPWVAEAGAAAIIVEHTPELQAAVEAHPDYGPSAYEVVP